MDSTSARRTFLTASATATAAGLGLAGNAQAHGNDGTKDALGRYVFSRLPPTPLATPVLPYALNALEPVISAGTITLHFGAHHVGYYTRLAPLAADLGWSGYSLEEIIYRSYGRSKLIAVYNAAAQLWNHNFYWRSLRSPGGPAVPAKLMAAIRRDFGSLEALSTRLNEVATGHFASGWAWLVSDAWGRLSIIDTHDADTPMTRGLEPLLNVDVWEHAYYVDFQNRRAAHVAAVVQNLLDWDAAARRYGA